MAIMTTTMRNTLVARVGSDTLSGTYLEHYLRYHYSSHILIRDVLKSYTSDNRRQAQGETGGGEPCREARRKD